MNPDHLLDHGHQNLCCAYVEEVYVHRSTAVPVVVHGFTVTLLSQC